MTRKTEAVNAPPRNLYRCFPGCGEDRARGNDDKCALCHSEGCARGIRNQKVFGRTALAALTAFFLITALIFGFLPKTPLLALGETAAKKPLSGKAVIEQSSRRILFEENADAPMEMASTTKIMTAYLTVKHADLHRTVRIPPEACNVEGSSIYLKEGEEWEIEKLLYGLMLRSGNDAATALAIAVSGSVEDFVFLMNRTAEALGLFHTHFENPHGLSSPHHKTTAKELALLTAAAMDEPDFCRVVQTKSVTFPSADGKTVTFLNKNKFLSAFPGACGVKTGYTKAAGRCFVSAAKQNGMTVIAATLNDPDMWNTAEKLSAEAFQNYRMVEIPALTVPQKLPGKAGENLFASTKKVKALPLKAGEESALSFRTEWCDSGGKFPDLEKEAGKIYVYAAKQLIFSDKIYIMDGEN